MNKKRIYIYIMCILLVIGVLSNIHLKKNPINRMDGFTNDPEISSDKYKTNQNTYHSIFKLQLAGPGVTAWDYATGKGVNVAVIDGGFDTGDKDLMANVKGCYNAIARKEGLDNIKNQYHGTFCAKTLGAVGNNQYQSAGVAYNANLYLIQVDTEGTQASYSRSVIDAIQYAVSKKCRVISMSLSDTIYDAEMEREINEVYSQTNHSILFVASAGNSGKQEYRYPASYDNVLAVSAAAYSANTGEYTVKSSTHNDHMDIAGPGNTTSAATAYAAGVAALLFEINPSLTAKECAKILQVTAKDKGTAGYDIYI